MPTNDRRSASYPRIPRGLDLFTKGVRHSVELRVIGRREKSSVEQPCAVIHNRPADRADSDHRATHITRGSRASDPIGSTRLPYRLKTLQRLHSTGHSKIFLTCVSRCSQHGFSCSRRAIHREEISSGQSSISQQEVLSRQNPVDIGASLPRHLAWEQGSIETPNWFFAAVISVYFAECERPDRLVSFASIGLRVTIWIRARTLYWWVPIPARSPRCRSRLP